MNKTERKPFDHIAIGAALLFFCHIIQVPFYFLVRASESGGYALPPSSYVIMGFGVIQLAYLFPLLILAALTRRWWTAAGLVVAALLTFVLNVLFFVLFLGSGNLVP